MLTLLTLRSVSRRTIPPGRSNPWPVRVLKRLSREVRLDECVGSEGRLRLLEHWRGQAFFDAVALEAERKSLCAGAAG